MMIDELEIDRSLQEHSKLGDKDIRVAKAC